MIRSAVRRMMLYTVTWQHPAFAVGHRFRVQRFDPFTLSHAVGLQIGHISLYILTAPPLDVTTILPS